MQGNQRLIGKQSYLPLQKPRGSPSWQQALLDQYHSLRHPQAAYPETLPAQLPPCQLLCQLHYQVQGEGLVEYLQESLTSCPMEELQQVQNVGVEQLTLVSRTYCIC